MVRPFVLLAAALLVLGACGSSDSGGATTTSGATGTSSTAQTSSSTTAPAVTATTCAAYFEIVNLYSSLEPIATGSNDAQVEAQATWDAAIAELQSDGGADGATSAAVTTLAKLTFTVTEDATGAPTEGELIDAFVTLDGAYAEGCGSADLPTECPAPETLETEGYTCDSEGNLTPIPGPTGEGGKVDECPAPEVLEENGFTCDSEGNLTPIG